MTRNRSLSATALQRSLWLAAGLLAAPTMAAAQTAPASASSSATMDMGSMPGMPMPAASASTGKKAHKHPRKPAAKPAHPMPAMNHDTMAPMDTTPGMAHGAMPGTNPDAMKSMDHGAMHDMGAMPHGTGTTAGMSMGPMQGGKPPPGARSPDYSDGIGHGSMRGMDMRDSAPLGMLLFDQLEIFDGKDGSGQAWAVQGWYGNDSDKLWLRSEGGRSRGRIEDGDVEALWSHAVASFWNTQLGARQDLGDGPSRHWAAFGIQGLAPYWFDLEATGYVGPSGRTAARLRVEYELLFTQRLILQPEFELNAYGRSDPARRLGGGLSDAQFGLRLRYEIRRQFAPYLGVVWTRRFGGTADFARDNHQPIFDRQWVAGVRIWF